MSRKTKEFDVFGVQYRTTQFSAARAVELMGKMGRVSPLESLAGTEAMYKGAWEPLTTRAGINRTVIDAAGIVCPTTVLKAVVRVVTEFNFAFLDSWKGVQIPTRFLNGTESRDSRNIDPLLSALLQNEQASLKELQEYYSLEDAFTLYDVIVSKSVNTALANEAAQKEAKARRR
jgi:hypothetical protein